MIRGEEIRQRLAAIADNRISLWDFSDWLHFASRNMHADSDPEDIDLASEIIRLFGEYDLGMGEDRLRERLLSLYGPDRIIRVHIMIDATDASRFVAPVPASSSHFAWVPQIEIPAQAAAGY